MEKIEVKMHSSTHNKPNLSGHWHQAKNAAKIAMILNKHRASITGAQSFRRANFHRELAAQGRDVRHTAVLPELRRSHLRRSDVPLIK